MPELPEVETVKRILEPQLAGRRIQDLIIKKAEIIVCPDAESFSDRAAGAAVVGLRRRGKFLLIDLDQGDTITIHLRMTGQLLVVPPDYPQKKHTHILFRLDDGKELRFIDVRRFGKLWMLGTEDEDLVTGIHKLGLEPFDEALTAEYLEERFGKRKITLKQALLDQTVIAGIGNIYADEILHQSALYPGMRTSGLNLNQWAALAELVPHVLNNAIEDNAISAEDYLNSEGKEYRSSAFFRVYGREGDACPVCGAAIKRIVIGGRSSYYCPTCQAECDG